MSEENPNQNVPGDAYFVDLRNNFIALPSDYRRVLFLGTTGAGKTTLVRQFIGTQNFPSTSAAKCTIHPTEIIPDTGSWRAVVTFATEATVRLHLEECISAAILAIQREEDRNSVLRRLLSHVDERFRFNYVLGDGPQEQGNDFSVADDESGPSETIEEADALPTDDFNRIDIAVTNAFLYETIVKLTDMTRRLADDLREYLGGTDPGDESAFSDLFEESLSDRLGSDDTIREITDNLINEIKKRFAVLPPDGLTTLNGWPQSWNGEWRTEQRQEFLRDILRFSSNNWRLYGLLLTPLVNGVRVAGPFVPNWIDTGPPKLVLIDGEGLGHTPDSTSSVSDEVTRNIVGADAVLLVDNATQRMQAATAAALREVAETANANKLVLGFTHFDGVVGDDLHTVQERARRVWDSVENQLHSFGRELGPYVERALRQRLQGATFFLSNLQNFPIQQATADQLQALLTAIESIERPQLANARPVYCLADLATEVADAVQEFHRIWRSLLRIELGPEKPEHWATIKALSRRLAENIDNGEYRHLRPVANLRDLLRRPIISFIENPIRWEGPQVSEQQKRDIYDQLIGDIAERLRQLSASRVWRQRFSQWQRAYEQRGQGSTRVRAKIIDDEIFIIAAPTARPGNASMHDRFFQAICDEVIAAGDEIDVSFVDVE